jgi:hypothetical protein
MSLPVPTNSTCAIYRAGAGPPSAPALKTVCFLQCDWRGGQEAGDRVVNTLTWTHVMLIDASTDIRDGYTGACTFTVQDAVYIPDQSGTQFKVVFVERVQRGTPNEYKRVFLDRLTPSWPSDDI